MKHARVLTLHFAIGYGALWGLPRGHRGEESACQCQRHEFDPWVRKIPWRRKWQPTPAFLPGKSLGQRSLVGYSPWGHKESDTAERLNSETTWGTLFNHRPPNYLHIRLYSHAHTIIHSTHNCPCIHLCVHSYTHIYTFFQPIICTYLSHVTYKYIPIHSSVHLIIHTYMQTYSHPHVHSPSNHRHTHNNHA